MIFNAFERMMALRYLRARRKEGFVSVIAGFSLLGIALGVATLIIVMAVMNGFRAELLDRILGLNGHVMVQSSAGPVRAYDEVVTSLRGVPGVVAVQPALEGQVMVTHGGTSSGALVRGMRGEDMAARRALADGIVAGDLAPFRTGAPVVMIGRRMADAFGVEVGDQVTLISPKGNVTAFGTVPRVKAYEVAAIFDVGMFEYDSRFVYMPLEPAQTFFKLPGAVTHIEVVSDRPDALGTVVAGIVQRLGPDFMVSDWTRANSGFFRALEVERNVMFLILTLIILVAAFNMVSGLIMLVKDKGHAIAILRTMGVTRGAVMRIFFLAGASVGLVGTGLGVALGVAFADNIEAIRQVLQTVTGTELFSAEIYFLTRMPADLRAEDILGVTAMAIGLSLTATLYPSWRAARLDPVEALRYE